MNARCLLISSLSLAAWASAPARASDAPTADEATLAPSEIPVDRSGLEPLTARLRAKVRTLGLDGRPGPRGETVSRALVLLPQDRAKPGVVSFELESGPRAGVHQCEVLGRGRTAFAETPGWVRGSIGTTTVFYAPMEEKDGATPPGVYDVRLISTASYELSFLNSPAALEKEPDLAALARDPAAASKPHFSGVWLTWYPKARRTTPIDMLWSEEDQVSSQGKTFPVVERRPEPKSEAERSFVAKQLARNPRYYFGPYGRSGLANHTDRWDDPERRADPQFAGRRELTDFRFRETDGCLKVRADCLELLDEFVAEQSAKGRRVQYEVRQTSRLDAARAAAGAPARSVTLAAVGDMRLDGPIADVARAGGTKAPFAGVEPDLKADVLFGNLETPVTTRGSKTPKTWNFRAKPELLKIPKAAGFDVLNVANNHVWDYGLDGFLDTLRNLRKAGKWTVIGAGKDREDAERVRVLERNGLRIGFVGLTSTHPEKAWATPRKPGVAYSAFERVGAIVSAAKRKCDVLVVSFHGGAELAEVPNEIQRAVAHAAVDAGADLFLGHHPHVLQPVELYKDKPVVYSLGNFLFVSPSTGTRTTAIARAELSERGVESLEFVPVEINWGKLKPAGPGAAAAVEARLDAFGALAASSGTITVRRAR